MVFERLNDLCMPNGTGIYLVHVCLDVSETNEMFINVADWSPRTARQNSCWEKKIKTTCNVNGASQKL